MYFCGVSCNFSFSFLSLLIWILSFFFFLMSLTKGLSNLSIFSKNHLLASLIFYITFFVSILFISSLIFMISFNLLNLGIICSFSTCFRWKVRLFAAKSPQSCPTLCDPIDGSPPGCVIPGILQARTLEWVAISFSNAWKWKVKVKPLSHVRPSATPWTAAHQAPPSIGFSRQEYWSGVGCLGCLFTYIKKKFNYKEIKFSLWISFLHSLIPSLLSSLLPFFLPAYFLFSLVCKI